ncbi:unnamed protein product [Mucor circinelloides]|uniref:Uncharacterized protein n=2 Tax=Mucor TaxID=4830 RepID=S2IVX2_MUCC1|nr:hypothetical protein HMPREF1544_11425 [Mucor circinelloides 1006PhL]
MGCCGSKEDRDEDDVNAPLLNDDIVGDNRMNYQTYETIDVQKEQEFWNNIIDRTTQNLIDISSSQTDPLQDTDVQERESKYRHLLEQIKPKIQQQSTLAIDTNINNCVDILTNAKPNGGMTDGEVDWLYQTMDEIQDALQHIDIQPVGDMVVHLTMTDNSTISAY